MTPVRIATTICILAFLCTTRLLRAQSESASSDDECQHQIAIAEFTAKQSAANWPALFEKVGKEFGVPGDILAGISFAETRWEHLTWSEGEASAPMEGMPPPYGVMSLWDNEFFGHSLIDAAQLIGKKPEELKSDPLQNIRGAAALLKKIYFENPLPEDTREGELESWFNAIAKYCGIPENDLAKKHALDVYDFLQEGYDQYGMKLEPHPNLKLETMRAEVKKIVEEERKKQIASMSPPDSEEASVPKPEILRPGKFRTAIGDRIAAIKNRAAANLEVESTPGIFSINSFATFLGAVFGLLLPAFCLIKILKKQN